MTQRRYSERLALAEERRSKKKRKASILMVVALAGVLAVGGTLAYITTETPEVKNTFDPAYVACEVVEPEYSDAAKTDVQVQNTGNIDAYIRAKIVVNWADEDGNVSGTSVKASDYVMEYGSGWVEGADGFWYWINPVAPEGLTGDLIERCVQTAEASVPEGGYYLSVEILASAIQSLPADVVVSEWSSGVSKVEGSILVVKTTQGA